MTTSESTEPIHLNDSLIHSGTNYRHVAQRCALAVFDMIVVGEI